MKPREVERGMLRRRLLAVAAMVLLTGLGATAQAPTPIVERSVQIGSRMVRTTLFSNRVAVVSVRLDGKQVALRQITLTETEFIGYLAAVQRDAAELAQADDRTQVDSLGGTAEITLHVGPRAPQTIHYSPVSVLDLVTSRLVGALDDLERRVLWGGPSNADLEGWQPRRGDRVELRTGIMAQVVDVGDDGTLVVEHDDTWIHEVIPPDNRATVILRVLEDEP